MTRHARINVWAAAAYVGPASLRAAAAGGWPSRRYIRNEVLLWLPQAAAPVARFDHDLAFLKERQIPEEYTPESARHDDGISTRHPLTSGNGSV